MIRGPEATPVRGRQRLRDGHGVRDHLDGAPPDRAFEAIVADACHATLAGGTEVLGRHKAELAAYEAKLTRAFDLAGAFRHDGSRNTVMWLVRNCRLSRPAAAAQVRLSRRLATMPATRTRLSALLVGDFAVRSPLACVKVMLLPTTRRLVATSSAG